MDLEGEIPFFLTHARGFVLVGESKGDGDGNGDSSYQCTEPGCNEDCTTLACACERDWKFLWQSWNGVGSSFSVNVIRG